MSGSISRGARKRLEALGFRGLDDHELTELAPWVRLTPAIHAGWTAMGTALGSSWVLWTLVPFALLGIIGRSHPFDALYDHGIRRVLGTRRMPLYRTPRRLGWVVVAVGSAAAGLAFNQGAMLTGYLVGGLLAGVELVLAATYYCPVADAYARIRNRPGDGAPSRNRRRRGGGAG